MGHWRQSDGQKGVTNMKLVDSLPRTVGQGRADGGGEDRSDLSMLGVRIPLAHERFPRYVSPSR